LATDRGVRVAKRHARQCNQCNGGSKDDTKHKGKCEGKRTIEKVFHVIATRSATFVDRSTTVTHTLGKFIATFSTRLARLDEDPVAQGRRHSRTDNDEIESEDTRTLLSPPSTSPQPHHDLE
jgi:hypothetical protein